MSLYDERQKLEFFIQSLKMLLLTLIDSQTHVDRKLFFFTLSMPCFQKLTLVLPKMSLLPVVKHSH